MHRLAEIIAGFALGLDLSLIAAVSSGQFATAHEKLGRNRPTSGMKEEYLDKQFFQAVVGDRGIVETWREFDVWLQIYTVMLVKFIVMGGLLLN